MEQLFAEVMPAATSRKRRKELFGYMGPFGSLSAKLQVAYVCRLLPPSLIEAVHTLKQLRNDRAHEEGPFQLKDYEQEVTLMFELLGPGIAASIKRLTIEWVVRTFLKQMAEMRNPFESDKLMFEDEAAAIKFLQDSYRTNERSETREVMDALRPRAEIAYFILLICGMINHHGDKLKKGLADHETLTKAFEHRDSSKREDEV